MSISILKLLQSQIADALSIASQHALEALEVTWEVDAAYLLEFFFATHP